MAVFFNDSWQKFLLLRICWLGILVKSWSRDSLRHRFQLFVRFHCWPTSFSFAFAPPQLESFSDVEAHNHLPKVEADFYFSDLPLQPYIVDPQSFPIILRSILCFWLFIGDQLLLYLAFSLRTFLERLLSTSPSSPP